MLLTINVIVVEGVKKPAAFLRGQSQQPPAGMPEERGSCWLGKSCGFPLPNFVDLIFAQQRNFIAPLINRVYRNPQGISKIFDATKQFDCGFSFHGSHCKVNYSQMSSILTANTEIIVSMENLGARIREVMGENQWEPPQVAVICGMKTPHAVYQWLDGSTKNLKLDNLYKFCRAANIHIEWLITGDHPKYKPEKLRCLELNFEKLNKRDQDLLCTTSLTLTKPAEETSLNQ